MSRIALFASATLVLACAASPAAAHDSWGKPRVAFAQYRADADQCSNAAFDAKLWLEPVYHVIRAGYAASTDVYSHARARQIVDHGVSVTIADQLQGAVDRCLIDRGYARFRLTDAQDRELARFRKGSVERSRYLHGLAADPSVMAVQALPTARPPEPPADEGKPRKQPLEIIDLGPRPL